MWYFSAATKTFCNDAIEIQTFSPHAEASESPGLVMEPNIVHFCQVSQWCNIQPGWGAQNWEIHPLFPVFKGRVNVKRFGLYIPQKGLTHLEGALQSLQPDPHYPSSVQMPLLRGRDDLLGNDMACAISNHQLLSPIWTTCSEFLFKMQWRPWIMACWFTCSWWIF